MKRREAEARVMNDSYGLVDFASDATGKESLDVGRIEEDLRVASEQDAAEIRKDLDVP